MSQAASAQRRKKRQRSALWAIALISIVAHAAVIAAWNIRGPSIAASTECVGSACDPEWVVSCESDAALTSSARLGVCASPFRRGGGGGVCARAALKQLEIDLVRCRSTPEDVEVALVDIDQIPAPAPLMPDVAPTDDIVAAQLIEKEVAEKLEEAQKQMSRPDPAGQVVEITRPQTEKVPENARYLSEFDSSVEKQTVARGSTEKMVDRPAARELPPTAAENPDKTETNKAEKTEPSKSTTEGPGEGPGEPTPSKLSMRGPGESAAAPPVDRSKGGEKTGEEVASIDGIGQRRGDGGRPTPVDADRPQGGATEQPGGGGGPAKTPNLRPTEELLERAVGGGSVDHLDDAESGDFTALNSRKWKYATFFNRMKRQVAQNWHPDTVYLRRDPSGNIYGTRDRITVLQVSLTPSGSVAKIAVEKESGVDFLDDEAIRAFREAQPFPNPPTGLVDARSNLITFSFGFHFAIGGDRSQWKVFRYQ